ncbi:MAG: DUF4362 domain-containing protein [Clostridium sp.]|uniref:DUF4362 domain-containing protein n=1 Tax=Clostridium culturomicium TaxID=1499683 RepID=UPI0005908D6C|nr:DUF4362 domain-containing protein [Clostridium culturomicium]MDU4890662.1 DUF4362 domain-containing protein [Clostridium sp.]MDU7082376.1 DUF4362 domain-containing protein [Clostridium sp.]
MKRVVLILSAMILCFFTTSLAVDNLYNSNLKCSFTLPSSAYNDLSLLSKEYLPDEAIKNGDVVLDQIFKYNVEILDNFIESYEKKTLKANEMVRITRYTIEGSPIISDLIFVNNKLILKEDKSRNFYSGPKDLIIKEYEIKRIYTKVVNNTIFYMVETTSGEKFSIAAFHIN